MIEPSTPAGTKGLASLMARPEEALVAFDYDGTLAPIVDDPREAAPHPEVVAAMERLAANIGAMAIVTGRPADVAVGLTGVTAHPGLADLVVLGHYGLQRWTASTGSVEAPAATSGVAVARDELPGLLGSLGLSEATIEDKELSVAVHVRRMDDPEAAFVRMRRPLEELAERADLVAEPGRHVIELRPRGMDKGRALRELADDVEARTIVFVGDDLGDLAAFDEVERRRAEGQAGILVCSGSAEVVALAERADIVVDGPTGVADFVKTLSMLLDTSGRGAAQPDAPERA